MNGENELPEGWTTAILKDITIDVKNVKPENEPNRVFEYVDISSINNQTYTIEEVKSFFGKDALSRARRPIKKDDILFSNVRTYLRNISIVPEKYDNQLCSTGFTVLRPSSCILAKYLFYFVLIDSFIEQVSPQQRGSQYPATSDGVVKSVPIPLPPLAEQRRIVAAVEALLARVNAARERLERVQGLLKEFRQAVLAAACSGRLTEGWRGKSNLGENELPEGWVKTSVGKISSSIQYGYTTSAIESQKGPRFLRITDIQNGQVEWSNVPGCVIDETDIGKYQLSPGDILFARTGATTGKSYLIRSCPEAIFASYLIRVRPSKLIYPNYLSLFFQTNDYWIQISDNLSGNAQPNCNASKLKNINLPLPPLPEQHEIVRRVESLFALADRIEQRVAAGKERADRLTQAILAKAFRGELVPTEAELARKEGRDYEPASVLLERIRRERELQGNKKPGKKRAGLKKGAAP